VPALSADTENGRSRGATSDPGLKGIDAVRREADDLAARRAGVEARMLRPLTGGASSLEGEVLDQHDLEEDRRVDPVEYDRRAARAVGTAVHRMMEELDPAGDFQTQLGAMLGEATAELDAFFDERSAAEAGERLRNLIDRMTGGRCLSRLAAIAENVVGREVAILALPHEDAGPIGAVTGFVDLVYRDPASDEMVIVDYKTGALDDREGPQYPKTSYVEQGAAYQRALSSAFGLSYTPRFELWFLRDDEIVCS